MPTSFFTDDKETPATPQEVLVARVTMARAYTQMKEKAYDALLSYGVNYRDGTAWKDTTLLDEAKRLCLTRSLETYLEWMARVERDIAAMIHRKTFRKV